MDEVMGEIRICPPSCPPIFLRSQFDELLGYTLHFRRSDAGIKEVVHAWHDNQPLVSWNVSSCINFGWLCVS